MELVLDGIDLLPSCGKWVPKVELLSASKPYNNQDCQINARNDLQAVNSWLTKYKDNVHTFKAYNRESKKLLLWCTYKSGKTLTQLKVEDFEAYFEFIKNPPAIWCASRKGLKEEDNWKPFIGRLSDNAFNMAVRVINSLLNYLVEACYLRTNPVKLIRNRSKFSLELEEQKYRIKERMLEVDEWIAVQDALDEMPEGTKYEIDNKLRTQFLFSLLYLLGLRIHEVEQSVWNAFRKVDDRWWFFIKGKGGKLGHIPVNDQLLQFIKIYRLHLDKLPMPNINETESLFVSKRTKKPLQQRQLYGLVKAIGHIAANKFTENPHKVRKLKQISPHWLRHLSASHQDKLGIPATVIQANHRHSSAQTTQIYLHAEDEFRSSEMQKMKMIVNPKIIEPSKSSNVIELAIFIKAQAVTEEVNFARLLEAIEIYVLQEVKWELKNQTRETLLAQFKKLHVYKQGIMVNYQLYDTNEQVLSYIIKAITREAKIRLFNCKIEIIKQQKINYGS